MVRIQIRVKYSQRQGQALDSAYQTLSKMQCSQNRIRRGGSRQVPLERATPGATGAGWFCGQV